MPDALLLISDLLPMNCADRDEEQRRSVSLENLLKSWRAGLDHNEICGRHGRPYTYAQIQTGRTIL